MYQGSLYYHRAGYNQVIKYDLNTERVVGSVTLAHAQFEGKHGWLYATENNFVDCAVDENGLWVMYGSTESDSALLVVKVDPHSLMIQKTWNVTVDHKEFGNGFIACGVLYLVDSAHDKITQISFAYDLYTRNTSSVQILYKNPFQMNNMISYNPRSNEIYSWDKGNQLRYPLLQ